MIGTRRLIFDSIYYSKGAKIVLYLKDWVLNNLIIKAKTISLFSDQQTVIRIQISRCLTLVNDPVIGNHFIPKKTGLTCSEATNNHSITFSFAEETNTDLSSAEEAPPQGATALR